LIGRARERNRKKNLYRLLCQQKRMNLWRQASRLQMNRRRKVNSTRLEAADPIVRERQSGADRFGERPLPTEEEIEITGS
jgi:hypothetical protein